MRQHVQIAPLIHVQVRAVAHTILAWHAQEEVNYFKREAILNELGEIQMLAKSVNLLAATYSKAE